MTSPTHMADWRYRPVLLLGPRKAGTTLLQSLLDGTDALLVYPSEVKLKLLLSRIWTSSRHMVADFVTNTSDPLKAPFRPHGRSPGPQRNAISPSAVDLDLPLRAPVHVARLGNLDGPTTLERFDYALYAASLREALRAPPHSLTELLALDVEAYRRALRPTPPPPKRWALKEVGGDPLQVVRFFKRCFPDGDVVVLLREPRWITRAIVLDRHRRGRPLTPMQIARQARSAAFFVHRCAQLAPLCPVRFVAYESLVGSRLEHVMRSLCESLEIPHDTLFHRPTTLGIPTVVRTASRPETGVFAPSARSWRDGLRLAEVAAIEAGVRLASWMARLDGVPAPSLRDVEQVERAGTPVDGIDRNDRLPSPTEDARGGDYAER